MTGATNISAIEPVIPKHEEEEDELEEEEEEDFNAEDPTISQLDHSFMSKQNSFLIQGG